MQWSRNLAQRLPKPALGRGRLQVAARRVLMLGGGTATTAEVAQRGDVRRLMGGGRIGPHQYRKIRRALAEIADPIGRAGGMGRPLIWRLKDGNSPSTD